ncbi:MAG: helix-turn-helix transcriptional regulator [Deltaproteobacteria bacterium]|nr:helix-turn-helix transcriptional regulator [Deltaproteobacteria bacterium]
MISDKIRELREMSGLSMEVVSGLINVSTSSYHNYESRGIVPNANVVISLCRVFGVSPNELLEWDND